METLTLTFNRNYGQYLKGTTAWFPVAAANVILASGSATIIPEEKPKADVNVYVASRATTKSKIVKK